MRAYNKKEKAVLNSMNKYFQTKEEKFKEYKKDLEFYERIKNHLKELNPQYYQLSGINYYIEQQKEKINELVLEEI